MRSESSAIWTSGEPVSPSCTLNCSMRLFFLSGDSRMPIPPGGSPPNRPVPRAPTAAPLGRVRWTTQSRVRTERSVTRGSEPFNRSPRGWCVGLPAQPPPGLPHVGVDLRLESVPARELHLGSDPPEEIERQGPVVEVPGEVEEVGLDPVLRLLEGRAVPDVDDGIGVPAVPPGPRRVHASGQREGPVGPEVRGGEPERAAPAGAP